MKYFPLKWSPNVWVNCFRQPRNNLDTTKIKAFFTCRKLCMVFTISADSHSQNGLSPNRFGKRLKWSLFNFKFKAYWLWSSYDLLVLDQFFKMNQLILVITIKLGKFLCAWFVLFSADSQKSPISIGFKVDRSTNYEHWVHDYVVCLQSCNYS